MLTPQKYYERIEIMNSIMQRYEEIDNDLVTKPKALDSFDDLEMDFVLSAEDVQLVLDNLADRRYGYLKENFESLSYEEQRQIINDSLFDVEDYLNDVWFNVLNIALLQHTEEAIEEQKKHETISLETEACESKYASQELDDSIESRTLVFSQEFS